ncbi:(d)CMP kinase [Alkaliflexus imshenetskii]|uniref:(d)CMP kinase n=1 Tax=Alkaliflexus imshenetskii TaxID=286730 RepID=UPI000A028548|nr:(d)CMP kinase [Alkaliflexus imshenetskii]
MSKNINQIIVAIDGHSSCGKSTVAKEIAAKFNLTYIDTGAMYRAVTYYALQNGIIQEGFIDTDKLAASIDDIHIQLKRDSLSGNVVTYLNGENVESAIRSLEVSNHVSAISALSFVRKRLVQLQQEMGQQGGVVLDGRDIGTVVFPNAELKIFMTASPEIRAKRRFDEMTQKGEQVDFESVLQNVISRDHIDSTRAESPLRKADDAQVLDNSHLTREDQLQWVMDRLIEGGWLNNR